MVLRDGQVSANMAAHRGIWPGRADIASSASPTTGGSSYVVNDKLTLVGGNIVDVASVFNVDSVTTGAVTSVSLDTAGIYNGGVPVNAVVTTTGGSGSGCTLDVVFIAQIFRKPLTPYDQTSVRVDETLALSVALVGGLDLDTGNKNSPVRSPQNGQVEERTTSAFDFFEKFHIIPRSFAFGSVLTTQNAPIEVYSAFRSTNQDWDNFINNAGAGVTLIGSPTLSKTFSPQTDGDLSMVLQISTSGPPFVDSTLDFIFDVPQTTMVPITLERVVMWNMDPETPYQEQLEFFTEVIRHKDGTEQRISPRKRPRQIFEWDFKLSDGPERALLDHILFDWQSRVFGIAMWHERTKLSAPVTVGDTTINVQSTAFADYRTTGSNLILVYQDQTTFDVLPLSALTATTLTLATPTLNSYSAGVVVAPMRTAYASRLVRGSKYAKNLSTLRMRFKVIDNDVDLADTSAFSSFNSKVLLDGDNGMGSVLTESFEKQITVFDGTTGLIGQGSSWANNRRGSFKTFLTSNRQQLWETRQLVHALRGKQVSFYLPTFAEDLQVDTDIIGGASGINIAHVGYTQFVQSRQPKNVIMIEFNNGDATIIRTITGSSVTDSTREALTLDANFPNNVTVAEVERISYVEKVRFDSDVMTFVYQSGARVTKVQSSVKVVLE